MDSKNKRKSYPVRELAARYCRLLEMDKKCPYNTAHIHLEACYATLPANSHGRFESEVNDIINQTGASHV